MNAKLLSNKSYFIVGLVVLFLQSYSAFAASPIRCELLFNKQDLDSVYFPSFAKEIMENYKFEPFVDGMVSDAILSSAINYDVLRDLWRELSPSDFLAYLNGEEGLSNEVKVVIKKNINSLTLSVPEISAEFLNKWLKTASYSAKLESRIRISPNDLLKALETLSQKTFGKDKYEWPMWTAHLEDSLGSVLKKYQHQYMLSSSYILTGIKKFPTFEEYSEIAENFALLTEGLLPKSIEAQMSKRAYELGFSGLKIAFDSFMIRGALYEWRKPTGSNSTITYELKRDFTENKITPSSCTRFNRGGDCMI